MQRDAALTAPRVWACPHALWGLAAVAALGQLAYLLGGTAWPLALSLVALGCFTLAVALAWLGWGRAAIPARSLVAIPAYVLAKVPLYIRFLFKPQKAWVKTERD